MKPLLTLLALLAAMLAFAGDKAPPPLVALLSANVCAAHGGLRTHAWTNPDLLPWRYEALCGDGVFTTVIQVPVQLPPERKR